MNRLAKSYQRFTNKQKENSHPQLDRRPLQRVFYDIDLYRENVDHPSCDHGKLTQAYLDA